MTILFIYRKTKKKPQQFEPVRCLAQIAVMRRKQRRNEEQREKYNKCTIFSA